MKGSKTYTVVGAGLLMVVGAYFQGSIDVAEALNQVIILLGIGGIRHGMKTGK